MTAAIKQPLNTAKTEHNFNTVEVLVHPEDSASQRLCRQLNFQIIGI